VCATNLLALRANDRHRTARRAKLEEIVPEMKEPLMTWAEELRQQGIQQGIQQGSRETARAALRLLLDRRFKQIPPHYEARIEAADVPQLEEWLVRFVDAKTLEAVFDG
jgi:hypothetical protein